jgi:hypothetical protein
MGVGMGLEMGTGVCRFGLLRRGRIRCSFLRDLMI